MLAASTDHSRWCASSTTSMSQRALTACAALLGDFVSNSALAEDELVVRKGIDFGGCFLDGFCALLVEDVEPQIEAAQGLHEPLVDQGFGHEDQDP